MNLLKTLTNLATLKTLIALALALCMPLAQADDPNALVLIGHGSVPRIDINTAQRLYTGRAVEVNGMAVTVVNLAAPSKTRERFMAAVMNQDEDRYLAYWTVRKHIGKGTAPREFRTTAELLAFVQATPGALGYVLASDLKPGVNVVLRP